MKLPALILTVMVIALLVAPASAEDKVNLSPKEQIEESAKKIKALKKERIDTLRTAVEQLTKLAQNARVEFGEVLEAQMLLLKAELDATEKESERIALYKKTIDAIKQYEEWANARVESGRGTQATVLKIKARRLEVEIQLEEAKIKEAKASK